MDYGYGKGLPGTATLHQQLLWCVFTVLVIFVRFLSMHINGFSFTMVLICDDDRLCMWLA